MTLFQGLIFVYSGFFWWDTRWVSQEPMMRLIDSSHSSSTSMILLSDSVHSVSPLIPYFTTLILGVDDALCPRWCASLIKEDPGFLLFLPREGSFYASRSKSFFSKKKGKGTQHTALPLPSRCRLRDSCSSLQLVCLAATRYSEAEKRTLSSVTLDPFLNKYVKTKHSDYTLSHGRGRAFLVQHF